MDTLSAGNIRLSGRLVVTGGMMAAGDSWGRCWADKCRAWLAATGQGQARGEREAAAATGEWETQMPEEGGHVSMNKGSQKGY